MNSVEQLCPNCGLCCDSTLFADVELRAGDDAKRLKQLGLTIVQKSKSKLAFTQPCACFDGKFCGIYADRPTAMPEVSMRFVEARGGRRYDGGSGAE